MFVREVVNEDFTLLHHHVEAATARGILDWFESDNIIVRDSTNERFYLFDVTDLLGKLKSANGEKTVSEALELSSLQPIETTDEFTRVKDLDGNAIVLDELGEPCGFYSSGGETVRGERGLGERFGFRKRVTKYLEASFPETAQLDSVLELRVELNHEATTEEAEELLLRSGSVLDLLIQVRQGLRAVNSDRANLVVPEDETQVGHTFQLKATAEGMAKAWILVFQRGVQLARVPVQCYITREMVTEEEERLRRYEGTITQTVSQVPDLSLFIQEEAGGRHFSYTVRLTSADGTYNLQEFGPVELKRDMEQYFDELLDTIRNLGKKMQWEEARQRINSRGVMLFEELFPEPLRRILWQLRDRITSIQVQSEEATIPWELCRLYGEQGGATEEGPFLCEKYAITRWQPGLPLKSDLTLSNIALVVPDDSGLPKAKEEAEYIKSLQRPELKIHPVRARYMDVIRAIDSGQYDGFHFTGHGGYREGKPDESGMVLEDHQRLHPPDIIRPGRNMGKRSPIVFLNACQIGRSAVALSGIGGWASRFMRAGAGAFIGAYWSIYDRAAYDFCVAFYKELLSGARIGDATLRARQKIAKHSNPTWLAYTVFGNPNARLSV